MESMPYDSKRALQTSFYFLGRRYALMAQKEAIGASVRACEALMPMFEHP